MATSVQRQFDVVCLLGMATSVQRQFDVMCLLGKVQRQFDVVCMLGMTTSVRQFDVMCLLRKGNGLQHSVSDAKKALTSSHLWEKGIVMNQIDP